MPGTSTVNPTERANFYHLVADIAWFGLALAATSRFLSIYAIRLGASPFELGLIASLPGLVLIVSTMLSVWWRTRYPDSVRAVFLPGLGFRLVFLLPAFAPFFPTELQVLWLIVAATLPAIPQGVAGAIFIVLTREAITDQERMNALVSRRNLAMNAGIAIGAMAFGYLLESTAFPLNYQLVFITAFVFSLVSQWHVDRVKVVNPAPVLLTRKPEVQAHPPARPVWREPAVVSMSWLTMGSHLAFFAIVAVVPLYLVERLNATESFIAMFGILELIGGSIVASVGERIIRQIGTRNLIAVGMFGTVLATVIIAFASVRELTLLAALITGGSWAAAGIGVYGYFMEITPNQYIQRAGMIYQQVIALALFVGPMIGSMLAQGGMDLTHVLLVGGAMRLIAAVFAVDLVALRRGGQARRQYDAPGAD